MRQLSKFEGLALLLGGLLMVVGAGANVLFCSWAPYVFAPGSLLFVAMQLRQRYEGKDFTIRRLRRIQIISDFLFLVAGLLMLANQTGSSSFWWQQCYNSIQATVLLTN